MIQKLNQIRIAINLKHQQLFPKSGNRVLSHYSFVPRRIKLNPSGQITGGLARLVTSLELPLGFELPVACLIISSNAEEGNQFIPLKEQLSKLHPNTKINLDEAKYNELH